MIDPESSLRLFRRLGRSVHVVIDLTPMLPGGENGGAKWFVLSLIDEWVRLGGNWRFTLLTTARNEAEIAHRYPLIPCLRVLDDNGRPIRSPQLTELPGNECADLLYAPFTAPFYAHPAVPTVVTVYDLQYVEYPQFFTPEEIRERDSNFRQAVAVADRLVCISDHVRDHVVTVTGLDPRRVSRIHISLPDRLKVPDVDRVAAVIAAHGLSPGRYLLYPANTWPHKNHPMLLTAAGLHFAARPESDLVFVCVGTGEGAARQALMEAVRMMGLNERFRFPGFVSESDLAALLAGARALIYPSMFEGFGMPVLEAMAAGIPVLASNRTSLPEITGDAALLFDPRRPTEIVGAIAALEDDPALARQLAAKGLVQARNLGTAASMSAAYLAVFAELVATERGVMRLLKRRTEAADRRIRRAKRTAVTILHEQNVSGFIKTAAAWAWCRIQEGRAKVSRGIRRANKTAAAWAWCRIQEGRAKVSRGIRRANKTAAAWAWCRIQEGRAKMSRRFPVIRTFARGVRRLIAR